MSSSPLCNIVFYNDDETTMDFVVHVLQEFLDLDFDEANQRMLRVHQDGKAICGTFERDDPKHGSPLLSRWRPSTTIRSSVFLKKRISLSSHRPPPLMRWRCGMMTGVERRRSAWLARSAHTIGAGAKVIP
jgi:ATP-dependent Clp protease adaptor protein ClpS